MKKYLSLGILLSIFVLASCDKNNDAGESGFGANSGSIIINGKKYSLFPSEYGEFVGSWNDDPTHPNRGQIYIYWLGNEGAGGYKDAWLEMFYFQTPYTPKVGDDLAKMSLKHLPANNLYPEPSVPSYNSKIWPTYDDWYDFTVYSHYVSGSLTVVSIGEGYLTVNFSNLVTENCVGNQYSFDGTITIAFDM